MQKFIKDNKALILGSSVIVFAAGAYFYFSRKSVQEEIQIENTKLEENSLQEQTNNYEVPRNIMAQNVKELASKINIKFNEQLNSIDLETISQIFSSSAQMASYEYKRQFLTLERRQQMNKNRDEYDRLIMEYNMDVDRILDDAVYQILAELNLTREVFDNSIQVLLEKGWFQQIFMLQASIRQKLKEYLEAKKPNTMAQQKDILKCQITILENRSDIFKGIVEQVKNDPEKSQLLPLIMNTILQDEIFLKFGTEEEDTIKILNDPAIFTDMDMSQLLYQIEQAMAILLQNLGLNNEIMGGGF